jgi:hypothetical protein
MGNRGILHDENKRIVRHSRGDMWLICRIEFNGRRQELMHPKRYTQLFFLDEAVALAAGHRPCGECRRKQYRAYIDAANTQNPSPISVAADLDRQLRASRREARTTGAIASLPDGAFISLGGNDFRLVWRGSLYTWSTVGYVDRIAIAEVDVAEAIVITPELSLHALRYGYPVSMHPSVEPGLLESPPATTVQVQPGASTTMSGGLPVSGPTAEYRREIEQILRASSPGLTHGEVFRYMERGLDAPEIATSHGSSLSNVRNFMRSLTHLFDGTFPESRSAARTNAFVYKELLNHPLSSGLRSYVELCLRRLMAINPEITMEPLRTRSHQYAPAKPRQKTQETLCRRCFLQHAGECD